MSTLFGGRECSDPVALYRSCLDARPDPLPTDWWGAANLFRNPLGRGPGAGAILLTKADLDALDLTTDHTLSFDDDRTSARPVELKKITLLRARCLTPGYRGDARAVYLCEVADRRHFLAQTPVDRAYNVRDAAGEEYLDATTNGGDPWTWQEVVADLWDALGLTDPSALPFTPDGSPENLRYHAADAWEALNDVLDRLACAVKLDHVADTFSIVRLGDAAAAGATALTTALAKHDRDGLRSWDAYHAEPNRGRLPETVRVLFPRRPVPTDGGSPYFAEDVTLAATAGVAAGTYVQLFDDLTAVGEGTPTNAAALTTRAEERAADWRRKRLGFERRLSLVYRDFRPDLVPGETVDQTALDDRGGPMTTVLEARPDGKLEAWRPFVPPIGVELTAGDAGRADCQKVMSGLLRGDCLVFRRRQGVGWCANVTQKNGPAAYHPESKCWVASTTFLTHEGRLATMYFYYLAVGLAGMAIVVAPPDDAEEGTEPDVYVGKWMGCVDGGLSFSFSDAVFCSGEVTGGCEDNYFRVWVACRGCAAPAQVCARSVGNPFPGVEGLEYLMTCHGYAYGTAGLTPTATGYHFEYVASGATYPVGQVGIHCSQVGCNTTDGHGWGVVTEADYTPDGGWVFTNPAYAAQAWSFDPFYLRVGFDGGTYFEAFGGACTCGEATGNQPQSLHYSGSPTSYGLEVTGAGGTLDALNDAFRLYYSTITVLGGWVDYGADFVTVLSVESGPYAGGGDPVYRLTVWDEYPSGTELAVFEKPYADWVVCGSNTLGLVHTAPGGTAPETVTVEPSGICYECRKGSGCGVADCDDGSASGERSPGSLVVDASGGGTTDFADIDAKYGLAWVDGTATWTGTGITLPLGYPAASYTEGGWAAVATRTAGTWTVVLSKGGTSATYSVSGLSTDCGENVGGIPLTSQVGTGTPPATVTITPCSGAGTTDSSDGYCPAELMMMAVAAGFRNADGTVPLDLRPAVGPGTHARRLLKAMGLRVSAGCACSGREAQMDVWGVEGCRANRAVIERWFGDEAAKVGWFKKAAGWLRAAKEGVAINPLNPAGSLLDEAIRRAEEDARRGIS